MKYCFLIILFLYSIKVSADKQYTAAELKQIAKEIETEGLLLFRSEMASWHGTDMFLERYQHDRHLIGGYFSYPESQNTKCVFFSNDADPKVIGTITFTGTPSRNTGDIDMQERTFTQTETDYYNIRKVIMELINADNTFKQYKVGMNIIVLADSNNKRAYLLSATPQPGIVLFGNDFLIKFKPDNSIASVKPLHKSLIPMKHDQLEDSTLGNIHTHIPGFSPFMSPTDICTAELYKQVTGYDKCVVVSENYINIWSKNHLTIFIKRK